MALVWCLPAYFDDVQRHADTANVARIKPAKPFAADNVQHVNHSRHKVGRVKKFLAFDHLFADVRHAIHALAGVAVSACAAFYLGEPAAYVAQPRVPADAIAGHLRDIGQ